MLYLIKKILKHIPIIFLPFLWIINPLLSKGAIDYDEGLQTDRVYRESIKTVLCYNSSVTNSYPIIKLGSETITLEFDELYNKVKDLQYYVLQCDANWQPTQMMKTEYLEGLFTDYLNNYKVSNGTYKSYIHYQLSFPTQSTKPKKSGNYIIKVFEGSEKKLYLQRRFYIYEPICNVLGEIIRPNFARYNTTHQQLSFKIDYLNLSTVDATRDFKVIIRQNWRTDNEVRNLKPRFIEGKTLIYNYDEETVFEGGNEFRPIDISDVRTRGFGVRFFTLDSIYHATLFDDDIRASRIYTRFVDQNGQFTVKIANREAINEADYIRTYFTLKINQVQNKDIYLFGALTDWKIDKRYKLQYSSRDGEYFGFALLKQGFYDFTYATLDNEGNISTSELEGSYWETENNYTVLVYYRPPGMNYDLLVGKGSFNSVNH